MDCLSPSQRHNNMAAIRSKDTKPELIVRKYLYAHGYRYRLQEKRLPGRPDVIMKRLHTVIMVNGCFWHGHKTLLIPPLKDGSYENGRLKSSECCKIPKTNRDFWEAKICRNMERDAENRKKLTAKGWNVIQIWECELKPTVREKTLQSLLYTLSQIELSVTGSRRFELPTEEFQLVADNAVISYGPEE